MLNSITITCSKHAYVQCFEFDSINIQRTVNMFERMEIAEYIYEGVLELSYKKYTGLDATCSGQIRYKRGEPASLHTYFTMNERAENHREGYVCHSKGESKTCLIQGPRNSSDECKVLGDFGYKYVEIRSAKDRGHNPATRIFVTYSKRVIILLIVQWMKGSGIKTKN